MRPRTARATADPGARSPRRRREGLFGLVGRAGRSLVREAAYLVALVASAPLRVVPGLAPAVRRLLRFATEGARRARTVTPGRLSGRATPRREPRTPVQRRVRERQRTIARRRTRALVMFGAVVLLGVSWFVVPATDLFRIRHVEVRGASEVGDLEVRERVDSLLDGRTIYTVDEDALRRRIERFPFVRSVRVENHFPGGYEIIIEEYEPLAIGVTTDDVAWLLARDGRVLAKAQVRDWSGRVPVIALEADDVAAGRRLDDEPALRLVRAVPADVDLPLRAARVERGTLVAQVTGGPELRFGRAVDLELKVRVAVRLIEIWTAPRHGKLAYIDVSLPIRPAVRPAG